MQKYDVRKQGIQASILPLVFFLTRSSPYLYKKPSRIAYFARSIEQAERSLECTDILAGDLAARTSYTQATSNQTCFAPRQVHKYG